MTATGIIKYAKEQKLAVSDFIRLTAGLTEGEQNLLLTVHGNHTATMSADDRKRYTLQHITKVERHKSNCLNVHFSNGEWWHYTARGEWF